MSHIRGTALSSRRAFGTAWSLSIRFRFRPKTRGKSKPWVSPPTFFLPANTTGGSRKRSGSDGAATFTSMRDGLEHSEAPIDKAFQDGDLLWDRIEVIHIPDAHYPEEVAFLVRGDGNTMIVGDAVCGGRMDRGVPDGEIWINAPEFVADLTRARSSLWKLVRYAFDKMCFGHGSPILRAASVRFAAFVEGDRVWEKLESEKIERTNPDSQEFITTMAARKSRCASGRPIPRPAS